MLQFEEVRTELTVATGSRGWVAHACGWTFVILLDGGKWVLSYRETDPEAVGSSTMFDPLATFTDAEALANAKLEELKKSVN